MYSVSDETRKPIFEGVQGENEAREIQFDVTAWVEELGEGVCTATAKRPTDTTPYPVTVTRSGNVVTWKPNSTDTSIEGIGAFQLAFSINDVVAKTRIWNTKIAPSLVGAGDPPDPYDDWIQDLRDIAAETLTYSQNAENSADDAEAEKLESEAWAKGTKNGTPVPSTADQYENNAKYFAEESYKNAEAWAVGQRGGVDVPSTDPAYENNAKYWAEQSLANQYGAFIVKSASGDIASFSDGADDVPMKSLNVTITPKQSGSGDPSPSNVRPITGWTTVNVIVSPTTTASDGTTTPVPLGQTVYGGTVNPISGELVIDRAIIELTSLNWGYETGNTPRFYSTTLLTDAKGGDNSGICSQYKYSNSPITGTGVDFTIYVYVANKRVYVNDSRYTNVSNFRTGIAGAKLVYELATPITVQLTPTQVATLLGTNNVWADCGSVAVEYRADPTLAYNELANVIVSLGGNL